MVIALLCALALATCAEVPGFVPLGEVGHEPRPDSGSTENEASAAPRPADPGTIEGVGTSVPSPGQGDSSAVPTPSARSSLLACIRSYEGDYATETGNGYFGAYQFLPSTWDAVAPDGWAGVLPSDAPPAVQDEAAWTLYLSQGLAPWPTPAARC